MGASMPLSNITKDEHTSVGEFKESVSRSCRNQYMRIPGQIKDEELTRLIPNTTLFCSTTVDAIRETQYSSSIPSVFASTA